MSNIKCYSCHNIYDGWKDFRYKCMCFNTDDAKAKYRGICLKCQNIPIGEWKEIPDSNHHMKKLHTHTKEWEDYYDATCGKHPYEEYNWSLSEGYYIFTHKTTGVVVKYKIFEGKTCTCCD